MPEWRYATNVASIVKVFSLYGFHVPINKIHETVNSQVALILKEEREKQGLSLNLLAEKAGLSRQAIAFVERELRTPSLDTLLRMASALKIPPEKIIARARRRAKTK